MKKIIKLALVLVLAALFTNSAFAQNKEKKTELFNKIAKLTQTKKPDDQEKAYAMSKDFLAQYGQEEDEQVKKLRAFVENHRTTVFTKNLDDLKIAEAFAVGKEILAAQPDNTFVVINMAYGGLDVFQKKQDKSFGKESVNYAKQALSMMEAGKMPASFEPFKDQAEVSGIMHYIIGSFTIDDNPSEAASHFYKALQFESQIKNTSYPYYAIALGYEKAYEKLAKGYQTKVANKAKESELIADQDKILKITDLMLDAYARAIKMAETDNNPSKAGWRQRFTEIYKYRNQSENGLNEYLNSVMSKPLTDPSSF